MEFAIEELQLTDFTTILCSTLVSSGIIGLWLCGGTSANVVRYNVMGYFGELSDVFTLSVIVLEDSANVIRYDATRFLGECSDVFTLSVMCEELQLIVSYVAISLHVLCTRKLFIWWYVIVLNFNLCFLMISSKEESLHIMFVQNVSLLQYKVFSEL